MSEQGQVDDGLARDSDEHQDTQETQKTQEKQEKKVTYGDDDEEGQGQNYDEEESINRANDSKNKSGELADNYKAMTERHSKHSTVEDTANETPTVVRREGQSDIEKDETDEHSSDNSEHQQTVSYSLNNRRHKRDLADIKYNEDTDTDTGIHSVTLEQSYLTDDDKLGQNSSVRHPASTEHTQTQTNSKESGNTIRNDQNTEDHDKEFHTSFIVDDLDNENIPLPISEPMSSTADIKANGPGSSEKIETQSTKSSKSSSRRPSVTSSGSDDTLEPKIKLQGQPKSSVIDTRGSSDISQQIITRKSVTKKPDIAATKGANNAKSTQQKSKRAPIVPTVRKSSTPTPRHTVSKERIRTQSRAKSAYPGKLPEKHKGSTGMTSPFATARRSRPRSCGYDSEARRRETEFFRAELQRLKNSLKKESSKIKKPTVRDHYPDVFTSLEPYYNTYTANYLIKMPEYGYEKKSTTDTVSNDDSDNEERKNVKDLKYTTRCTAIGLTDPWDSLKMDKSVLPKIETTDMRKKRMDQIHNQAQTASKPRVPSSKKRPEAKMGSTRLPKFPVINLTNQELLSKKLAYGDVPMLRDEAVKTFSMNGPDRKQKDYNRTRQDFYRMELDRINDLHPLSKPHMRKVYFAYLQNTPGSRKAIYQCMKDMKTEGEGPEPQATPAPAHATPPPAHATPPPQAVA